MNPTKTLLAAAATVALLTAAPAASLGAGDREPTIKILGPQGRLNFEVRPRDACDSFAASEITVRLKGAGVTKNFTLDEPCGDWSEASKSAPGLTFTAEDGTTDLAGRLKLRAVGDKPAKRSYRFTVKVDGDTAENGTLKVEVRTSGANVERFVYVAK
jgi:hypothetical protein